MILDFASITILILSYYVVSRFLGICFLNITNSSWRRDFELYVVVWCPGSGEIFFLFLIWLLMVLIIDTRTSALAASILNRFYYHV